MTLSDEEKAEVQRLNELMLLALRLGFHDDVRHWKSKREELLRNAAVSS